MLVPRDTIMNKNLEQDIELTIKRGGIRLNIQLWNSEIYNYDIKSGGCC